MAFADSVLLPPLAKPMPTKRIIALFVGLAVALALFIGGICAVFYTSSQASSKRERSALEKSQREAELLKELKELGGKAGRDSRYPPGKIVSVGFSGGRSLRDEDCLSVLQRLPDLESINLRNTDITGAGLVHLKGLSKLHSLHLGRRVTNAGLEAAGKLTSVRTLVIDSGEVSDEGLSHLASLTNLERLHLRCVQITDAGLGHLENLSNLTHFALELTKVTDDGIQELNN